MSKIIAVINSIIAIIGNIKNIFKMFGKKDKEIIEEQKKEVKKEETVIKKAISEKNIAKLNEELGWKD